MTAPAYIERGVAVYHGDCMAVLGDLPESSVDAVVTDPPYGLEFMGKEWDRFRLDDRNVRGYNGRKSGAQGGFVDVGSRIPGTVYGGGVRATTSRCQGCGKHGADRPQQSVDERGRWPANVVLDSHAADMLDEQTAELGGASRFFFTSKATTSERLGSIHPTVKPVDLMRWIVGLVTPTGGTVLDPFAGTGTTGQAAIDACRPAILIEQDGAYLDDIARRLKGWGQTDGTLLGDDQMRIES